MFSFLQPLFPAGVLAPVLDYPFARSDVAMLQTLAGGAQQIDRQTWNDLLLDPYTDRLAQGSSIFGQQELHRRLCSSQASDDAIERTLVLMDDAPLATSLQRACRGLRQTDTEIAGTLYGAVLAPAPWWRSWLWLLPLALLLAIASTWLVGWPALFGVLAVCVALMAIQSRYYEVSKQWERTLDSLRHLLKAHAALARLDVPATAHFRGSGTQAKKIVRGIERSLLRYLPMVDTVVAEYGDWLLLKNITRYFRTRQLVAAQIDFLRDSFSQVAALEADLALARHLREVPVFCRAGVAGPRELALQGMVHPLLPGAVPLSFRLQDRGSFISGQNGIGKSTLLRTVGLNLVCARAFGFCHAQSAHVPLLRLYSSMQSEDSLAGGESLYLAELRRARELLALADSDAEGEGAALFIIDEIFRGTNHLESISAAAAVLHTLAARHLVIVSSHNLVLAPLLEDCLAPWCVQRDAAGALLLAPGVLQATNGIALLAERGFGSQIEDKAGRVFDWLSGHMAQPADCSGVLEDDKQNDKQNVLT
ncbi:DNA mismatch repair protein MutS [Janthinobacterium sp. PC23-8]|uniref:MutS-related protein n=1 Tax=Janthinobacterium sp. PC23-8 TaxID=2012679 RepID=UPI000B9721D2|nr:DNA mismatch repair protein MutS [Janthinobacterium sp. PC23-8]OYO31869.1 DNA mismatch repair protein MutS [Janthinobacterium sp. PC23-8]